MLRALGKFMPVQDWGKLSIADDPSCIIFILNLSTIKQTCQRTSSIHRPEPTFWCGFGSCIVIQTKCLLKTVSYKLHILENLTCFLNVIHFDFLKPTLTRLKDSRIKCKFDLLSYPHKKLRTYAKVTWGELHKKIEYYS